MKKKKLRSWVPAAGMVGIVLAAAGLFAGVYWICRTNSPIVFKEGSGHAELAQAWSAENLVQSVWHGKPEDAVCQGDVNTDVIGEYQIVCTANGRTQTKTITVSDTEAPILKVRDVVTGLKTEVDPETFVTELSDASEVSLDILNPESLDPVYHHVLIEIAATDIYGNQSTASAWLTRVEDVTAPEILSAKKERTFKMGEEFIPQDLKIQDDYDEAPSVEVRTESLNMDWPGTYEVLYIIRDAAGNETRFTELVTVSEF